MPRSARRGLRRALDLPARISFWLAARGVGATDDYRRLASLRDVHRGRRAWVIGNGPSLNRMDLTLLRDEITFGSNAFYLARERAGFLPTYYNVEDPLPAEDNAAQINALEGTTKILAHYLDYCLKPDPNTIYVYFDRYYLPDDHPNFPRFSPDARRGVYWGGTVAYMSLQLAFYMGIRQVYLIGVDLDYKVPDHASGDVIVSREDDVSHFHPDYFGPGKRWHHPRVERMARSFFRAGEFFRAHGGDVFNATVGGKLEALPRVDYRDVLQAAG